MLGVVRIRIRMNIYEVIYMRGRDHDDWDKLTVTATNEDEAKAKAQRKIPGGCRLKRIKLMQTSAETRTNPCNMAQAKISRIERLTYGSCERLLRRTHRPRHTYLL